MPVRLLYGERDRILPDVAKTMRKVAERVPQAELSTLPDCGHFCQEERPDEIGEELARFFGPPEPAWRVGPIRHPAHSIICVC